MFTNNYINWQKHKFFVKSYNDNIKLTGPDGTQRACYGANPDASELGSWMWKARCREIAATEETSNYSHDNPGVYFGTGSTPATKDDYKLEAPLTSGLTITNPSSVSLTNSGSTYIATASFILTNSTEAEINIREVGLFTPVCNGVRSTPNSSGVYNILLMERTVLTEPITIPAGGSKLVTYKLTFNQTEG